LKHGLITAGNAVASAIAGTLTRHPRQVTAVVAALLLGGGGGAFAVASLAPDAAELPVRQVLESVTPAAAAEVAATDAQALKLYRSDATRSTDTADTLLKRLGVVDAEAAAFLRRDALARQALVGRAGRAVTAEASDRDELLKLSARWASESSTEFQRLVIDRTPQGFVSRIESAPLAASSRLASGSIRSSLFAATDEAAVPDSVATQLAEIFSGDVDFHRSLRKGDRFSVVYETLEADGEPLRAGRVLSAEFQNNGKTFQAVWFQEPGTKGGYYTLDGNSLRKAYLASPMEFSRVTSGFKMRFHPIHQTWRAHLGVDYAAPTGTPVRSVGDGVVGFAGVQNGFGNVVFIRHRNGHETVYAHLSRIGVRVGQSVSQGDTVGAVGSTGWATGPHLHFEFRVNGQHQDPMAVARQSESVPITAASRAAFSQMALGQRLHLQAAGSVQQASAE
jgi:murein DD-endopeptidase MepM/ murein hydrolase activator NlpD